MCVEGRYRGPGNFVLSMVKGGLLGVNARQGGKNQVSPRSKEARLGVTAARGEGTFRDSGPQTSQRVKSGGDTVCSWFTNTNSRLHERGA